jgi:RNA polymerase sigma-B factor
VALCESALTDRPRLVRVDLSGVPLLDAAGMAALVAGHQAAQRAGAEMRLERTRPAVVELMCRAGLAELAWSRRAG